MCCSSPQAISCHYSSGDCHFIDVTGTTQEVIADEVADLVSRKFGVDTSKVQYQVRLVFLNDRILFSNATDVIYNTIWQIVLSI